MQLQSLRELFVHELRDLHDAERQLVEAFPQLIAAASDEALIEEMDRHFGRTREHRTRLDRILDELDEGTDDVACHGMKGLLREARSVTDDDDVAPRVRDAALIAALQKIEHYEIAGYGTVRTYAQLLGEDSAGHLLGETLEEEAEADRRLTRLADDSINAEAMA